MNDDPIEAVSRLRTEVQIFREGHGEQPRPNLARDIETVCDWAEEQNAKLNSPELLSFRDAVVLEAAHQRERWGSDKDAGKAPQDWFWLIGYLAGKALAAHIAGNTEKALHHTISTAAALNNWHAAIMGVYAKMRPGIAEEKQTA